MVSVDRAIGRRLRVRRQLSGLTLEDIARLTGVCFQTIQKYESGAVSVSAAMLWRLSRALGVEPGYFFTGLDLSGAPAGAGDKHLLPLRRDGAQLAGSVG